MGTGIGKKRDIKLGELAEAWGLDCGLLQLYYDICTGFEQRLVVSLWSQSPCFGGVLGRNLLLQNGKPVSKKQR